MLKYFLIFILNLSLLMSQNSAQHDLNPHDRFDEVQLHLDFNNSYKTSFLLDKYYPNHFSDQRNQINLNL